MSHQVTHVRMHAGTRKHAHTNMRVHAGMCTGCMDGRWRCMPSTTTTTSSHFLRAGASVPVSPPTCLPACPPARPSLCPASRPSVRPSVGPSVRPSSRPSVRPSNRPSVRLCSLHHPHMCHRLCVTAIITRSRRPTLSASSSASTPRWCPPRHAINASTHTRRHANTHACEHARKHNASTHGRCSSWAEWAMPSR